MARAERTGLELAGGGRIERHACRAGTLRAARGDHGYAARLGIAAELAAQLAGRSDFSRKGRIRSIGAGKMIVEELAPPPISSSVCR